MTKILEEKLLSSDFTFGFELESYIKYWNLPVDLKSKNYLNAYQRVLNMGYDYPEGRNPTDPGYEEEYGRFEYGDFTAEFEDIISSNEGTEEWEDVVDDLIPMNLIKEIVRKTMDLDSYFPKDSKWVVAPSKGIAHDGSLGIGGFEYRSPVMRFTPEAIDNCIKFLTKVKDNFEFDEKCGFHTHLAFNGITEEDAMWITLKMAMNKRDIAEFTELNLYNDPYPEQRVPITFQSEWADTDYLNDIKKDLQERNYEALTMDLSNEKYRFLRIHPQGTLEWRAPRDFLNTDLVDDYIESFFLQLYKFVSWMRKVLDEKTLEGCDLDRDNLMEIIKSMSPYPLFSKKYTSKDNNDIAKISTDVSKLFKIKDASVQKYIKLLNELVTETSFINSFISSVKQGNKINENLFIALFVLLTSKHKVPVLRDIVGLYDDLIPFKKLKLYRIPNYQFRDLMTSFSEEDIVEFIKVYYDKGFEIKYFIKSYFYDLIKNNDLTNSIALELMEVSGKSSKEILDIIHKVKNNEI